MLKPSTRPSRSAPRCCPNRSSPTLGSSCRDKTPVSWGRDGIPSIFVATRWAGFPYRRIYTSSGTSAASSDRSPPARRTTGPTGPLARSARSPGRTRSRHARCPGRGVVEQGAAAFELDKEAPAVRDRYGRTKWGQSLLLACRLLEAGVRMVFVNWPARSGRLEFGESALGHPFAER